MLSYHSCFEAVNPTKWASSTRTLHGSVTRMTDGLNCDFVQRETAAVAHLDHMFVIRSVLW
jgi:hypothetical protein